MCIGFVQPHLGAQLRWSGKGSHWFTIIVINKLGLTETWTFPGPALSRNKGTDFGSSTIGSGHKYENEVKVTLTSTF